MVITGSIVAAFGWEYGFIASAIGGFIGVVIIQFFVSDTPQSKGLPSIQEISGEEIRAVDKKPTKIQVENEELKSHIIDILTALGKPATVTEIMNASPVLKDMQNQKVTALVTALYNKGEGRLNRELIQRKAHFSIKE